MMILVKSKPIRKIGKKAQPTAEVSIRDQLNKELDPRKFAKLELERLKGKDLS